MFTPINLLLAIIFLYAFVRLADLIFTQFLKKPLWVHFYWYKKKLTKNQLEILHTNFPFYGKLSNRHKTYFEHRLATFINKKNFVGRENLVIDDEKEVRIAATATMLTFGMRTYQLPMMQHILVYPKSFYSQTNDQMHKGEFNPKMQTLVLSWEDFVVGFENVDDNINLGIHEFTHAIHLNFMANKSTSATLFISAFNELPALLLDERIKVKLKESEYFRSYAFTNKFEFLAVVVESFIENPQAFKREFPKLYVTLKRMFNFRFKGY